MYFAIDYARYPALKTAPITRIPIISLFFFFDYAFTPMKKFVIVRLLSEETLGNCVCERYPKKKIGFVRGLRDFAVFAIGK